MPPDLQAAQIFHDVEVGVVVQQGVVVFDAVSGLEHVHRAADGVAHGPQKTVVLRGLQGVVFSADFNHGERSQGLARGQVVAFMAEATQHLEQHQIGHRHRRHIVEQERQIRNARGGTAIEKIDPHRAVDQDHAATPCWRALWGRAPCGRLPCAQPPWQGS